MVRHLLSYNYMVLLTDSNPMLELRNKSSGDSVDLVWAILVMIVVNMKDKTIRLGVL